MAGRTDRVRSNELEDRAMDLIFEAEVVRDWVDQLEKRFATALLAAKDNDIFITEHAKTFQELACARDFFREANEHLTEITPMVERRVQGEE